MKNQHLTKSIGAKKLICGCICAAFFAAASAVPAFAANGLDLKITYPGIAVKPGDSLNIPVTLSNTAASSIDADVALKDLPEGFEAYFQGGNFQISRVHLTPGENADITLHLNVPKELESTDYDFTVCADGTASEASDAARIHLNVNEANAGNGSFKADYPKQAGDSGTAFSFSTTLVNNGLAPQSYSFSDNAPDGWTVSFAPKGQSTKVAGIDVDAGASQNITVSVTAPENIAAGTYTIPVSAVSSEEELQTELQVEITGSYKLTLHTPDDRLSFDVNAGSTHDVTLSLTNDGNVDLENVKLSAKLPSDWTVTYDLDNDTVPVIAAGTTTDVVAHVKSASKAITGDYAATFTASNSQTSSDAAFRISVKTSTIWGLAAVVIIAAVLAGIAWVFKKYGRR